MARIRTIKPEFWTHPIMGRLPDDWQLLAISLLSHSDDHGYFMADPTIIRGSVQPFRESLARISEGLARLSEIGFIELRGHPTHGPVGRVVHFTDHQRVDHPGVSKIKRLWDSGVTREILANVSRDSRETLAMEQGTGNREQGTDIPAPPAPSKIPFMEFWNAYAFKKERTLCEPYWKAMPIEKQRAAIDGIPAYHASKPDPQYRLYPIRYLKRETWTDENIPLISKPDDSGCSFQEVIPTLAEARKLIGLDQ